MPLKSNQACFAKLFSMIDNTDNADPLAEWIRQICERPLRRYRLIPLND